MVRLPLALLLGIPPALLCAAAASAQGFPEGSVTPSAAELRQSLENRVLDVKLADGVTWRLEYKPNGYYFVNTSQGFNGAGSWSAEDGKLCSHPRGAERICSEVRLHQNVIHAKRPSGEIIRFVPR